MLFKSGDNLFTGALRFISGSENISLFSAYIKRKQLELLNKEHKIKRIIVRWEIRDLHQGSSDLDVYHYCKENNIALFRNSRLHLKCLLNERNEIFLGSANITSRGIGEIPDSFNYELNSLNINTHFSDILYLDKILSQSELVTENLYNSIIKELDNLETFKAQNIYNIIENRLSMHLKDYFLISELPMFKEVSLLYFSALNIDKLDQLQYKCVLHDLATYDLDLSKTEEEFYIDLNSKFNSHPFIKALKEEVRRDIRNSLSYGSVVRWIVENTTSVPTPISWELKKDQVVNTLYNWICYFDEDYTVSRPRHSEILLYKSVK